MCKLEPGKNWSARGPGPTLPRWGVAKASAIGVDRRRARRIGSELYQATSAGYPYAQNSPCRLRSMVYSTNPPLPFTITLKNQKLLGLPLGLLINIRPALTRWCRWQVSSSPQWFRGSC